MPKVGRGRYAQYIDQHFIPGYKDIDGIHDRLEALDSAELIHHPGKPDGWPGLKRYAAADRNNLPQNLILEPGGFTNYNKGKGEYLGYDTQKPLGLLKKLIAAACPEGGLVLDPFCGCGTTVDAAEILGRRWIGCDISYLSIDLIESRLTMRHGKSIRERYTVQGAPEDMGSAERLALETMRAGYGWTKSPKDLSEAVEMAERQGRPGERHGRNAGRFEFQRWAVSLVDGSPNDREIGDGGADGFLLWENPKDPDVFLKGVIQVKSGEVGLKDVRELAGLLNDRYQAGLLITLKAPGGKRITEFCSQKKTWKPSEKLHQNYPRLQVWSIDEYFEGKMPGLPPRVDPVWAMEGKSIKRRQLSVF